MDHEMHASAKHTGENKPIWDAGVHMGQMRKMMNPNNLASHMKPKLGTGERFAALKATLAARGAKNPSALAAHIGRKKYGKAKFQKLVTSGK